MKGLFRTVGNFAMLGAAMAFLVGITLFLTGSFLITWPLHRTSPRNRKLRATMDMVTAGMTLLTAMQQEQAEEQFNADE